MSGADFDSWAERMARHAPRASAPGVRSDQHDASADAGSGRRALMAEARELVRQYRAEFDSLRLAGLPARELRPYRDRIQSVRGRLQNGGVGELRRVITDLRSMLRDVQQRNREVPEGGFDFVDVVEDVEEGARGPEASGRDQASREELVAEARDVDRRARAAHDRLNGRIPEADLRRYARRHETLRDVLGRDPDAQALRRCITDLRGLLEDLEARGRESGAGTGAGGVPPNPYAPPAAVLRDGEALMEEARGHLEALTELVPDQRTDLGNFVRQINSLNGRMRDANPRERQRCVADLAEIVEDLARRVRVERRRAGR